MTSPNRSAETFGRVVTTMLDAVALLAIAAGFAGGLWRFVGWWALALGGVVLLFGSVVAAAMQRMDEPAKTRVADREQIGL
jgi:hypothetical protein